MEAVSLRFLQEVFCDGVRPPVQLTVVFNVNCPQLLSALAAKKQGRHAFWIEAGYPARQDQAV
jgi:hypothetical protein